MSFSTAQDIIALRAPGFVGTPGLSDMIGLAGMMTGTVYGAQAEYAKALLTLHWLTLRQRDGGMGMSGSSGAVTSESEGSLSRSYGSTATGPTVRDASLSQTAYGLELLSLRDSTILGFRNRMM